MALFITLRSFFDTVAYPFRCALRGFFHYGLGFDWWWEHHGFVHPKGWFYLEEFGNRTVTFHIGGWYYTFSHVPPKDRFRMD